LNSCAVNHQPTTDNKSPAPSTPQGQQAYVNRLCTFRYILLKVNLILHCQVNELTVRKAQTVILDDRESECDFIRSDETGNRQCIQVCWELTDDNRQREIDGFVSALKRFGLRQGTIVNTRNPTPPSPTDVKSPSFQHTNTDGIVAESVVPM